MINYKGTRMAKDWHGLQRRIWKIEVKLFNMRKPCRNFVKSEQKMRSLVKWTNNPKNNELNFKNVQCRRTRNYFREFSEKKTTWGFWSLKTKYERKAWAITYFWARDCFANGLFKNWTRKRRSSHGPLCWFAKKMRGAWSWARETSYNLY